MKSTSQIFEQENRISKLLWQNTTRLIKEAHPETGGNLMLTNNWGNEQAKKIADRHMNYQSWIFNASRKAYDKAFIREYPDHVQAKVKSKVY